jgi:hypothetical protein
MSFVTSHRIGGVLTVAFTMIVSTMTFVVPAAQAGDIPPVCHYPQLRPVCTANLGSHTASFTGNYTPSTGSTNDTEPDHQGTCVDETSAAGQQVCLVIWHGGNPKTACIPNASTPWYQAPQGTSAWSYAPAKADASTTIGGDKLYAEGGGLIDASGTTTGPNGQILVYRIHLQIQALCGNEGAAQSLVDGVTADGGTGSLDLSKGYKFEGYVDIL